MHYLCTTNKDAKKNHKPHVSNNMENSNKSHSTQHRGTTISMG